MDGYLDANSISNAQNTTTTSNRLTNSKKRKKMTQEERAVRSRERNRVHARKIRAQKKLQAEALHHRIGELKADGDRLRQLVDERYTASLLLGLSQTQVSSGKSVELKQSKTICGHAYLDILDNPNWFGSEEPALPATISTLNQGNDDNPNGYDNNNNSKKNKRRIKSSPQERDRIRRERNRIHAKRTRDRKKMFLEASEQIISRMENECLALREYLVGIEAISAHEADKWNERDRFKRLEIVRIAMAPFDGDEINMNPNIEMDVQNQQRMRKSDSERSEDVDEYLNDSVHEDGEEDNTAGMDVDDSVAEGLYGLSAVAMQQYQTEQGHSRHNNGFEGSSLGSNNDDTSNESTGSNQNEKSSSSNSTGSASASGSGSDNRDGLTQKALNSRNQQQQQQQQNQHSNSGSEDGATSGSNSNNSNDVSNDLSLRSSGNGLSSSGSDDMNKSEASSSDSNSPVEISAENSSNSNSNNSNNNNNSNSNSGTNSSVANANINGYVVDSSDSDVRNSSVGGSDKGDEGASRSSLLRQKLEEVEKHILLAKEMEAAVTSFYINNTEKE